MAYTRSDSFEQYSMRSGMQSDTIIKITKKDDVYYFSTRPFPRGLNTTEPFYPMLISHSSISEEINFYSKQFSNSNVNVVLSNAVFYPNDNSTPLRASDILTNINGATIDIYQFIDGITDISDCLLIFKGRVLSSATIKANRDLLYFTAHDNGKLLDKKIPTTLVKDEYEDAPTDTLLLPIPIVYGSFNGGTDILYDTHVGLAKAIRISDDQYSRYIISNHACHIVGTAYAGIGGPTVIPIDKTTNDNNDGGKAWIEVGTGAMGILNFFMDGTGDPSGLYNDGDKQVDTPANINIHTSMCNFPDNDFDDGNYCIGIGCWRILFERKLLEHMQAGGRIVALYSYLDDTTDFTGGPISYMQFYLYYGRAGGPSPPNDDERVLFGHVTAGLGDDVSDFVYRQWSYEEVADMGISSGSINTDTWGQCLMFGIEMKAGGIPPDSIVNNQDVIQFNSAVIRLKRTFDAPSNFLWVGVQGRSGNISKPESIVRDLYMNELGLSTEDIDEDSFTDSINTTWINNVQSRICIDNIMLVSNIVQQLAEQSYCVFHYSGAGKLRCINLDDESPTITTTIKRGHLINDTIDLSKTSHIINKMTIKSRWQGEYGQYRDSDIYEDVISQNVNNVDSMRIASYDWQNVCGESASNVAEHYVNATNGIWSKEHIQVTFEVPGFMYSYLQPGDYIALHEDVNNLQNAYGDSWEDKKLLIIKTEKSMDRTAITAVEIYRDDILSPSPEVSPSPDASPSPYSGWGLYVQNAITSPITLASLPRMTDGDEDTEVGSDNGYVVINDQYGLRFFDVEELSAFIWSFIAYTDRNLSALTHGAVDIYYSNDNSVWTKWGTTRTYLNGGIYVANSPFHRSFDIIGDGPSISATYWKFVVIEAISDGSTVGITELKANTV